MKKYQLFSSALLSVAFLASCNGGTPPEPTVKHTLTFVGMNCEMHDEEEKPVITKQFEAGQTASYHLVGSTEEFNIPSAENVAVTYTETGKPFDGTYSYNQTDGSLSVKMTADITVTATATQREKGKIFHIATWSDEFKDLFIKYVADKDSDNENITLDGVEVQFSIIPNAGNEYQHYLDENLPKNATAEENKKIDLFLAEADYLKDYTNSIYSKNVKNIGVTDNDLACAYEYTIDAARNDSNNEVRGISYQACPQVFIYRRSLFKSLIGTDDPAKVQEKVATWEAFDALAAKAKEKGYYITPTFDTTYRTFSCNKTGPWVDSSMNLLVNDTTMKSWIDETKKYVDSEYTTTSAMWSEHWNTESGPTGKSLFFIGPSWLWKFSMSQETSGDWGVCEGPEGSYWGGSWMLAAEGGDNDDLVAKTMKSFISNEEVCRSYCEKEGQFTNNKKINEEQAADGSYGDEYLAGQNPFGVMCNVANKIELKDLTIYDTFCNDSFKNAYLDYFNGNVTEDVATTNFYGLIEQSHPEIITPLDPHH